MGPVLRKILDKVLSSDRKWIKSIEGFKTKTEIVKNCNTKILSPWPWP